MKKAMTFSVLSALAVSILIILILSLNSEERMISKLNAKKIELTNDLYLSIKNEESIVEDRNKQIEQMNFDNDISKDHIKRMRMCRAINTASIDTNLEPMNCNDIALPATLTPDELFYTYAVSDKPYVSQREHEHSAHNRGGMLAVDVASGFQAVQYAPDYFSEVKAFTVTSHQDECLEYIDERCRKWNSPLGNYIELSFKHQGDDMKFVIGHVDTRLVTGDIVFTGQKIGQTNMTGVSTGHHAHIELWLGNVNISYSKKSQRLMEQRAGDSFEYKAIEGDGNLSPDSQKYKDAAEKYNIDWRMISSIHCAETFDTISRTCSRHTKNHTSSAGAKGCMQFMPKTWNGWTETSVGYGVDGSGDGVADINNCLDNIYSAANKLGANYHQAISKGYSEEQARWKAYRSYNHADWYANRAESIFNSLEK